MKNPISLAFYTKNTLINMAMLQVVVGKIENLNGIWQKFQWIWHFETKNYNFYFCFYYSQCLAAELKWAIPFEIHTPSVQDLRKKIAQRECEFQMEYLITGHFKLDSYYNTIHFFF